MLKADTHRLIALIYETAVEPSRWQELLEALAEFLATLDDQDALLAESQLLQHKAKAEEGSIARVLRTIEEVPDRFSTRFNDDDIGQVILSHFQCALRVAKQLADHEGHKDALASVLDQLPMSLLIVDASGRILESNLQARNLLAQACGITQQGGLLTTAEPKAREQLGRLIRQLARKAPGSPDADAILIPTASDERLVAYLSPVISSSDGERSNVAIFLSPMKSQPLPVSATFASLYSLTSSERDICSLLARGLDLKEIADHRSSSQHTVRSQIKSVFSKTGVSRQTELVSLILTGPSHRTEVASGSILPARLLRLNDGRHLAYREFGDPKGRPMVFHHSVLGSSLEVGQLTDVAARKLGVRIIAPERPGFGSSDPKPGRTVMDWADDLRQLLDGLGLAQVDLAGYSMGALFAKAAAVDMPQRIRKILLISSGVAASTSEEFAATVPLYRLNNRLARDLPAVHRAFFSILRRGVLGNPERFFRQLLVHMTPDEARYVESEDFRRRFFEALTEGARQGSAHAAREIELLMSDWGFDPAQVTAPTELWHGEQDCHVPPVLSHKLAARMPNARTIPVPNHGHFMIYDCIEEILSRFLQQDVQADAVLAL